MGLDRYSRCDEFVRGCARAILWLLLVMPCVSASGAELTEILRVSTDPRHIEALRLSGGGKFLAAAVADYPKIPPTVEVFDLAARRRVASIANPERDTFIDISDRGDHLAIGDLIARTILGIDATGTAKPLASLKKVGSIACDSSGNVWACVEYEGGVARATVRRVDSGSVVALRSTGRWDGDSLAVTGDGSQVVASAGGEIRRFDSKTGEQLWSVKIPKPYHRGNVAISPTGEYVAVGSVWLDEPEQYDCWVWRGNEPRPIRSIVADRAYPNYPPRISPDGKRVIMRGTFGSPLLLVVYGVVPGDRRQELLRSSVPDIDDKSPVTDFCFGADSSTVFFVTGTGVVYRWKLDDAK